MVLNKNNSDFYIWILLIFMFSGCLDDTHLEWHQEKGYRWAALKPDWFGGTGFAERLPSETYIAFRNDVPQELIKKNRHYLNGSGVAAGDINNDGLTDLYFAGLTEANKLYLNKGNFQFKDITERAGVAHANVNSTGVVFADINNDGYPDLLITSLDDHNALYLNNGDSTFTLQRQSGLGKSNGATTMALADINGDNFLDLYITNYKIKTVRDMYGPNELAIKNTVRSVNGELQILPRFQEYYVMVHTKGQSYRNEIGEKDELYLNNGDGSFTKVDDSTWFFDESGRSKGLQKDWGLTARFHDVNNDRQPDLYVANDFWSPDRLWINRGDGTFREASKDVIKNSSFAAMGVDFSDIDRDGDTDFMVTEMLSGKHSDRIRQYSDILEEYEGSEQNNRNSVYLNRGDHTFAQIAYYSQLEASGWSWGTYFLDVNLDGYEDLFIANGFGYDYQDMDTQLALIRQAQSNMSSNMSRGGDILEYPPLPLINKLFVNKGDLTFDDVSRKWGFTQKDISQGAALADLDNDGDMDVAINRFNDPAAIYENTTTAPRIAVRLQGKMDNFSGTGARVQLKGGPAPQSNQIVSGGNYLSGSQPQVVFAASGVENEHQLSVFWPDGSETRIDGVKANRLYDISYTSSVRETPYYPDEQQEEPMFNDISDRISHKHYENKYDDFKFGPLLPHKLSRQGPATGWIDVNRDGRDDILITSGKSARMGVLENRGEGQFTPKRWMPLTLEAPGDQVSLASWQESGKTKIVVGSANYEQGDPDAPSAFVYTIDSNGEISRKPIEGILSTTGPVAAADYTGDGRIDLFVGGNFKPGQYPEDARSRLFENVNGEFQRDSRNRVQFREAGLVTGALFVDLNQDGWQDLLLSTEWGTLKLYENTKGQFREITAAAGLDKYSGWWRGIAVGDFNGDGRADIAATNIGENSSYQLDSDKPLRLYYADFNGDSRLDIVDTYFEGTLNGYVPRRKLHDFESIPTILRNITSHSEFAQATVGEIFNRDFSRVPFKTINTLQSMLFLNRGNEFETIPLPREAQFSVASHAGVADVNNDGAEDLFISQNYFGFPDGISRQDAGRGLLLLGDGNGGFVPVEGQKSGIKIYGEQRGAAFGDFNKDGKVDLVVSQNNEETVLLKNNTPERGYRITLQGSKYNNSAIGSSLRLIYTDGSKGPRKFIQAGSGYRSQNSNTKILGKPNDKQADKIQITWFDSTVQEVEIEDNKWNYIIRYSTTE